MPAERLSMRKVREVLRLRHALSLSYREISEALGVGKTAAGEIVRRAEVVGLTWPLPQLFDDGELERRLFTAPGEAQPERSAPDWAKLHEELKRRSVTLVLLWQEYRAEHPDGYGYSRFCDLYGEWRRSVSATMRQTHAAGEKLFGFRRRHGCGDRSADRRHTTGAHLCCRARRLQLHLRGRALERGAPRLDQRACQYARRNRRRAEGRGLRQPQGWRHQAFALRAWHQS